MSEKSKILLFFLLLVVSAGSEMVHAHKEGVHELLLDQVIKRSNYQVHLQNLGIDPNGVYPASSSEFLSVPEMAHWGIVKEDSTPKYINHFYDPTLDIKGAKLTIFSILNHSSPIWALELQGPINFPQQEYSLRDVYNNLYKGITLSSSEFDNESEFYSIRDGLLGKYIQGLYHVTHHIMDMSQPQHTRNDAHPPLSERGLYEEITSKDLISPQLLEQYPLYSSVHFNKITDYWFTKGHNDLGVRIGPVAGQGLAEFTNRNFVTMGTNFGKYGTEGFRYSWPSMYGQNTKTIKELSDEVSQNNPGKKLSIPANCLNKDCELVFYETYGTDLKTNDPIKDKRASTWSIFGPDLLVKAELQPSDYITYGDPNHIPQLQKLFSLNRFNFDSRNKFVLPRAIGYSVGFLDHVMRGQMQVVEPRVVEAVDSTVKFKIQFKIRNTIDLHEVKEWKDHRFHAGAKLTLMAEYSNNAGEDVYENLGTAVLAESVLPGNTASSNIEFILSDAIGEDPTGIQFRLVYKGKIGKEIDFGEQMEVVFAEPFKFKPTGFLVTPNYAPLDGLSGAGDPRLIYKKDGIWKLSKRLGLQAGNTDWKGRYDVDGKPTEVLSWMGQKERYGYYEYSSPKFTNKIYKDGEVFAIAPQKVLGAALTKDGNDKDWLLAITLGNDRTDVVWRREAVKSSSPEGWEEVARLPRDMDGKDEYGPISSWFFNGDGTEAQTMRLIYLDRYLTDWWLRRYKIKINTSGSVFSAVKSLPGIGSGVQAGETKCTGSYDKWGSGSRNSHTTRNGSMVFAVDYGGPKGNKEILGRLTINSKITLSSSADAMIVTNSDGEETKTGESGKGKSINNYTESLSLGSNSVISLSDKQVVNWEWEEGSAGNQVITGGTDTYRQKYVYYSFDLRYGLLGYHDAGSTRTFTGNRTAESWVYDYDENYGFTTGIGQNKTYGPIETYHFKYQRPAVYSSRRRTGCVNASNFTGYWWNYGSGTNGKGAWLVDTNGDTMFTQHYVKGSGGYYEFLEKKSYLTNGNLLEIIPPAQAPADGPLYAPAGLIH